MIWKSDQYIAHCQHQFTGREMFCELFGPLLPLEAEWRRQGASEKEISMVAFDWDYVLKTELAVNTGAMTGLTDVILEDNDEITLLIDSKGRKSKLIKQSATIPLPLEFPVETMDDWLKIKHWYTFREDRVNKEQLLQEKNGAVVFVDESAGVSETAAVAKAGCVLRWDAEAAQGGEPFLKSIGATRSGRKITLYAMKDAASDNLRYAQKLLLGMKAGNIAPEQTSLVIRSRENAAAVSLQVLGDTYGYGTVTVVQETDLVARTLVRHYPPCDHLTFDENGKMVSAQFEMIPEG